MRLHWVTPGERRLALLIFVLSLLGTLVRGGRSLSPEVAAWIETVENPPLAPPRVEDPVLIGPQPPEPPSARIDPNTADVTALMELPGIGPALAARIVEDRLLNGPYGAAQDLQRVRGIGPATVARLRDRLALP